MTDDGFGPKTETVLRGITDEEILEMIRNRRLILGPDLEVHKFHESRKVFTRLKKIRHDKSGRSQYAIRVGNRYRKISAPKLFVMLVRIELIPEGFDVDHVDKDRLNNSFGNLKLRESRENQLDNVSKMQLEKAHSFFDEIIERNARADIESLEG